ncbi:IS200/IS605 family transposase OrfB [Oleiphilus messinensis]|uniref:IS200/IS605 family transposase OrfB n=1 Tax=Oleiphilus messinensis TaxID=141451 RepID=A0A1Y0I4V5_9GAMM|nr:RNA-guided endonuclease TnpB family protein [Oleiphilus messinensis]ARU55239.1 IS200/IS605 family transposase OrfB [Oleiphilus messinensis]
MKKTKTLKVRIKDKHVKLLNRMARSVNFVWNYINELSSRSIKERGVFLSAYDIHPYTKGAGKELGLHSQSLQCIAAEYVTRRKQFKKARLNWRKSGGVRRSLGWIPVNTGQAKWKNGQVFHNGRYFSVWDSFELNNYKFRSASFSEDSRGRWYFNVVVDVEFEISEGTQSVGIDLGFKESATDSNGNVVAGREYRLLEQKLGIAQRAGNQKRVKAIHAKIKNRRQDALHKYSRKLVNENAAIFVGNVSSQAMVKTKKAKSALDAGWGILKTMLEYKCDHAGVVFEIVNEAYSTQTCSCCRVIPDSSPKGRTGLGIREWVCSECGAEHQRDINAARNILAVGHDRLAVGIPVL